MRRLIGVSAVALGLLTSAPALRAQTCSDPGTIGDACAVASDFFRYMGPQLGTSIAGGSHTLGIGTNLGGFPHFALALRVNGVMGHIPVFDDVQIGAAAPRTFELEDGGAAMITADFALGLTKGFSLGVTRIGGVDLIGGVTYVPEVEGEQASLTPETPTAVGLGARVGLLQQSALIPGVSVSYMVRNLPTLDVSATADDGSTFGLNDFTVKTKSWRLSAQKNLLLFQFFGGIGGDTYDLSTAANVTVSGGNSGTMTDAFTMNRTTMYGGLGINLLLVKVVAEVGQVSGGSLATTNDFATMADASRTYAGVGIRISF